jgi:hypothetical protein
MVIATTKSRTAVTAELNAATVQVLDNLRRKDVMVSWPRGTFFREIQVATMRIAAALIEAMPDDKWVLTWTDGPTSVRFHVEISHERDEARADAWLRDALDGYA